MGARNVSAAFVMYPKLHNRAFRLLVYMALTSLDDYSDGRPPRVYYGGRDAMVQALDLPETKSGHQMATRVVGELVKAGAVERTKTGGNGRRSEYRLNLDVLRRETATVTQQDAVVTTHEARRETATVTLLGDRHAHPQGDRDGRSQGDRHGLPKENRGTTEESPRGQQRAGGPSHLLPMAEDGYAAAHALLSRLDPDRSQALMAEAEAEGVDDLTAQVIRAAELAPRKTG